LVGGLGGGQFENLKKFKEKETERRDREGPGEGGDRNKETEKERDRERKRHRKKETVKERDRERKRQTLFQPLGILYLTYIHFVESYLIHKAIHSFKQTMELYLNPQNNTVTEAV
jgi:hypothetical protein